MTAATEPVAAPGIAAKRVSRNRAKLGLRLSLLYFGFLVVGAVAGSPVLGDPDQAVLSEATLAPGAAGHILGTDPLGRDVLSWMAASALTSLRFTASVVALSALAGAVIGAVAAYSGGWIDALLMRMTDLQLAVPPFLLFLAASAVIKPSLTSLILLFSVVSWVPYARLVRTRLLVERQRAYVAAARLAGAGPVRVLAVHLLPTVAGLVLVLGSLQAGYVLIWEATLSFLGLGINPPEHSLGYLMAQGRARLSDAWWVVVFPGLLIATLVFAFNTLGDALRTVLIGEPERAPQ